MKNLLILGAGTAGTMVANKMRRLLDNDEWRITIVDQHETHYYQPGFLFIPFGMYSKNDVIKPKRDFIPQGVELIMSPIEAIEAEENRVKLAKDGRIINYDFLVIATGAHTVPDETPGIKENGWHKDVFDFYTIEGALALANPIKCPVAPLEFLMLADWFFHEQGIRDRVEISYATPLPGAFTKPIASKHLGDILEQKGINVIPDFYIERVDPDEKKIVSYDEMDVEYDLLVTVPLNMGAEVVGESGLGDDLNFIPVDQHTFLSPKYDNMFVLGDAANLPTSKAGSVAHFAVDAFAENFVRYIDGLDLLPTFDGHANCFIESGFGKGLLIDFNYDVEPLPGKYPLPGIGPFSLLQESEMNHWGKMMFRWLYWNTLLKGEELPLPAKMTMAGKWNNN